MKFFLSPSSGHADSYFDVKFTVEFDTETDVELQFTNETANEKLNILSVFSGHIRGNDTAVFENIKKAEGVINLFNDDKMNNKLSLFPKIDIKCEILTSGDSKTTLSPVTTAFYNESMSVDAEVLPVDLFVDDAKINIEENEPLRLTVLSDSQNILEFCIKSKSMSPRCSFNVYTRKGRTNLEIPSEYIYSDLQLNINSRKQFSVYYVKHEGILFNGFANRKYIPIPNTKLNLHVPNVMLPVPQSMKSPTGTRLPREFVISDRYMVPVLKENSSFGAKSDYDKRRLGYLTRFFHESQDLQEMHQLQTAARRKDIQKRKLNEVEKVIKTKRLINESPPGSVIDVKTVQQSNFLNSLSRRFHKRQQSFDENETEKKSMATVNRRKDIQASSHTKPAKKGCLPCSRKKQKNV